MTDSPGSLRMPVVPGLSEFAVLARGGYATVYRAVQEFVGREVAVKVENRTLDNERDQRRFLREARAAGRMSSHPYVVDLYGAGVTDTLHPYLIMELCDGSYADRMKDAPLSPAEARDVGVKIADALSDAHQLGVLHRDVKPANILLSRFGEPNLADFGLAILAETRDSSVTLEVLTPAYAPPEMFRHSAPSPAVDVYALCATLYAVIRGRPPRWHEDRSPSLITLMDLFTEPIPDLPDVPPALMQVLRVGMANDPAARPSAAQLRDMLAAVPLGPAGAAGPVRPVSGAGVAGSAAPGPHAPVSGPPAPVSGAPGSGAPVSGAPVPGEPGSGAGPWPSGPAAPGWTGPPGAEAGPGWTGSPGTQAAPGSPAAIGRAGVPGLYGRPGPPDHQSETAVPLRTGRLYPSGDSGHTVSLRRKRRLKWFLGGALALLLVVGAIGWIAAGNGDGSSPPGGPTPRASTPTLPAGLVLPGCLALEPERGRCPTGAECYDQLTRGKDGVTAAQLPCTGRHTWEVFAVGDLPAGVGESELPGIGARPDVRALCNQTTFLTVSTRLEGGWQIEVLPPGRDAFRSGDRAYRCLAGKGRNKLNGPTLVRPRK